MSEETGGAPPAAAGPRAGAAAKGPLGSWTRAYVLVLAALALDILLLWWLTERYR